MSTIHVTVEHEGKTYEFDDDFSNDDPEWDARRASRYMYTEGNYACDCNLSDFIADKAGVEDFPDLLCGSTITVVELRDADGVFWSKGDADVRLRLFKIGLVAI